MITYSSAFDNHSHQDRVCNHSILDLVNETLEKSQDKLVKFDHLTNLDKKAMHKIAEEFRLTILDDEINPNASCNTAYLIGDEISVGEFTHDEMKYISIFTLLGHWANREKFNPFFLQDNIWEGASYSKVASHIWSLSTGLKLASLCRITFSDEVIAWMASQTFTHCNYH